MASERRRVFVRGVGACSPLGATCASMTDSSGRPLRVFPDHKGVWRYAIKLDEVSPLYVEALLNYEDRAFWSHPGVDPLAMLTQIRAKLRPSGTLLIVTHNEKSLLRRAMGVRWPPFCLQHPELYNPATITALLARAGYAEAQVARSRNYFPLPFLARQALWALGLKPARVPLPQVSLGLRLGNMLTLATAPAQAAAGTAPLLAAE